MKLILFFVLTFLTTIAHAEDDSFEIKQKPRRCPICGSGNNPKTVDCLCEDASTRQAYKYACGPACDAMGYCCNVAVTTRKMRCG